MDENDRAAAPEHEGLWTILDLAGFLGVAPKTVRKWQLSGRLPFVKLGAKLVRFQPHEIRSWLSAQAVRPASPDGSPLVLDLRRRLSG